jgi:catechol 2,3-dioxygenase-like lactoylglutathione lyase family enzyme
MIRVHRLAHATFETPDLEMQIDHHQRVLGLTLVQRDGNTAYFATSGDHHTIVLKKGTEARCTGLGFQLGDVGDLDGFARQTAEHGIAIHRLSDSQPAIADLLQFQDTQGIKIEVFRDHTLTGKGYARSGIVANKLGHVAFSVTDVRGAVSFYCNVLGFRESDWMADFFAFLRCSPDHHTINFVNGARSKIHHIAFELRDWGHVKDACDVLAEDRIPLAWGPVRHGIGHNIAIYHRNPDGIIVEHFTELDRIHDEGLGTLEPRRTHQEFPQKGKVWTDIPLAANMWGSMPPADFLE